MAGRVCRSGEPLTADRDGEARVWVPLLDSGERMGVVALTVPEATDDVLADCVRLGRFAGLLVRSFARSTDLIHCGRRRRPMTLAAGMQWDPLPPTAVRSPEALACGRLEPAYEIAGDAFDYVMNDRRLHAAIFDGMGHGMESTLMTTLAVERLIDDWEQQSASDAQPDDVLRRLVESMTSYVGNLRDDASLLLITWNGSAEP